MGSLDRDLLARSTSRERQRGRAAGQFMALDNREAGGSELGVVAAVDAFADGRSFEAQQKAAPAWSTNL